MTYALYLGSTAAKASRVERPARLGFLVGDETWFFADEQWADRDLYLSVAALDLAGNESARTEPVLLRRAPSGCSTSRPSSFGTIAWALLALVAQALRGRARRAAR